MIASALFITCFMLIISQIFASHNNDIATETPGVRVRYSQANYVMYVGCVDSFSQHEII